MYAGFGQDLNTALERLISQGVKKMNPAYQGYGNHNSFAGF